MIINPGNKKRGISPSSPVLVTCFEEFPGNFSRTSSCDWFLRNSWDFLRNCSKEIPENFSNLKILIERILKGIKSKILKERILK